MNTDKTLLIVDDEPDIRKLIARYFGRRGFAVKGAASGAEMHQALADDTPDVILLDVCLPDTSGFDLLHHIKAHYSTAVIMLTAQAKTEQRIAGLNQGADDYLPKPFDLNELEARIKAVLRRNEPIFEAKTLHKYYCFEGFCLDTRTRLLLDQKKNEVKLTPAEYELLLVMVKHAGTVLDRDYLMLSTRGRQANIHDRAIDVRLSQLRKKLRCGDREKPLFSTVRGGGYMLDCMVDETNEQPSG